MHTEYSSEQSDRQALRLLKRHDENPFATQTNKFLQEPFELRTPLLWTTKDANGQLYTFEVAAAGGPMEGDSFVTVLLDGEQYYARLNELERKESDSSKPTSKLTGEPEWLVRANKTRAAQRNASGDYSERDAENGEVAVLDGVTGELLNAAPSIDWPHANKHGTPTRNPKNLQRFLQTNRFGLYKDVFNCRLYVTGFEAFDELNDEATNALFVKAVTQGLDWPIEYFRVILRDVARRNQVHPVRQYLDGLVWDGVSRIGGWLQTYLGAPHSEYIKYVGAIMLVAAVRRVRQPGCKFDIMVVLEGSQGTGKSTCLRVLAGLWFTDCVSLGDDTKRMIEQTCGAWIVEVPEVSARYKAEAERVKNQLSTRVDRARKSYGRDAEDFPRQFILIGTTNEGECAGYLIDTTGNRRFWPVKTGKIDLQALERDRDQLWAEAAHREKAFRGELTLPRKLWGTAATEQEARREKDPLEEGLVDAIAGIKDGFVPTTSLYNRVICLSDEAMHKYGAKYGRLVKGVMIRHGWRADYQSHPITQKRHRGFSIGAGRPWLTVADSLLKPEAQGSPSAKPGVRAV